MDSNEHFFGQKQWSNSGHKLFVCVHIQNTQTKKIWDGGVSVF